MTEPGLSIARAHRPGVSAEVDLALGCLGDPADRQALSAALEREIDWQILVQFCLDHAITEPVFAALSRLRDGAVPEEVLSAAARRLERRRAEARSAQQQLLDILRLLEARGIPALPFKGPALAELLYGDAAMRSYRDLDFLVPLEHAGATLTALVASRYQRPHTLSAAQDAAFLAYAGEDILFPERQEALPIEPHWAFAPHTLAVDLDYAAIWRRTGIASLLGTPVRALAPEDLLIALCIHGGKEEWIRLQWICDIAELMRAYPGMEWGWVLNQASRLGGQRMLALGLVLATDLIGTTLPQAVWDRVEAGSVVQSLAAQVSVHLFSEADHPPRGVDMLAFSLKIRARLWDRVQYAVHLARQATNRARWLLPLPAFFSLLYYLLRPIWLIGKYGLAFCTTLSNRPSDPGRTTKL